MVKPKRKKLLVAVDGTDRSLDTVRYLSRMSPFMNMDIVLYHIFSQVPEYYWDISKEPKSLKTWPHMLAWQTQMRKNTEEFMEKCRDILLASGYSPQQIKIKIQNRNKGIARDIVAETRKDYTAIVLRRRGRAGLKGIIMGDISSRLLEKLTFLPMIIAGKKPVNKKILIAMDNSADALRTVSFVGETLKGKEYQICLIHILRNMMAPTTLEAPMPIILNEYMEMAEKLMEPVFEKAGHQLIRHGFSSKNITTKIITDTPSRAGGIVREAENGEYSTIVMGRRGISKIRSYVIGRVSNKVVQVGRQFTVWIVN